jgi:threonyl-tRNA synthetase
MIRITFPDGAVKEYQEGSTAMDIARSIAEGLPEKYWWQK